MRENTTYKALSIIESIITYSGIVIVLALMLNKTLQEFLSEIVFAAVDIYGAVVVMHAFTLSFGIYIFLQGARTVLLWRNKKNG